MDNLVSNTREKQIEKLKQDKKRLQTMNEEKWNKKYKLAKAYYEHYENLEVKAKFKTINGYEYDENGINLGDWIYTQRRAYKEQGNSKITEEQIELLEQIEMRFNTRNKEEEWDKKYKLAKAYYEHYGDLEVLKSFKTINGYEYDGNGINLGTWITTQRNAYNRQGSNKITEEQIELLEQIGMRFNTRNKEEEWNKKYELAKAFYEHHGDLEIPTNFKTINGYEYDESGVALGIWIFIQRQAYKGQVANKITKDKHSKDKRIVS